MRPASTSRAGRERRLVVLGLVVGVPVSCLLLWLAVRQTSTSDVVAALTDADAGLVALGVLTLAAVYLAQALRWKVVSDVAALSPARFAEMVVSGVAVNNVVPGRVGDLLRARWLQVGARIPAGRALATVFVDRAFDVLALVAFLAVSLPFVTSAEWTRRIAVGGALLLVALALVMVAARLYTRRRARDRREHRRLLRRVARDALDGLSEPFGKARTAAVAGLSLAAWLLWAVAAILVARSVGIELSLFETVFVTAVINLGVAIPSSPGFVGTYQWLGVSSLGLLGVPAERALAFAILMHAAWYVPTLVVGGALLARRGVLKVRRSSSRSRSLGSVLDG